MLDVVQDRSSYVGHVITSDAIIENGGNIPTGKHTSIRSIHLGAGSYIIYANVAITLNTTGTRMAAITDGKDTMTTASQSIDVKNPPSYATSCHNLCRVVTTSGGDFYLTVYQSSGGLLPVMYSYMRAIMISKNHFVGTISDVEESIDNMYT